jgi:hypothetical protein
MPDRTVKRRVQDSSDAALASDDGPIFSTVAKLVEVLGRAIPTSHDLELKADALRLGHELLRGMKYEEGER